MRRQVTLLLTFAAWLAGCACADANALRALGLDPPVFRSQIPRDRPERPMGRPTEAPAPAADPRALAAERQREAESIQRIERIRALWIPLSGTAAALAPAATEPFLITASSPVNLKIPQVRVVLGTPIPTEALRRATAILGTMKDVSEIEDLKFLAGEVSHALEGAPLRVVVPEISARDRQRAEALRPVLNEIGVQQRAIEQANATIAETVRSYSSERLRADPAARNTRLGELKAAYKQASDQRKQAQERLRQANRRIEVIVLDGTPKP